MNATIVLVHGAWHGAWSWSPVHRRLEGKDLDVIAVDLPGHGDSTEPLTDIAGHADAVRAVLDDVDGPVVLAGHSMGGAVITRAGNHDAVSHLVYVAAFALDRDESIGAIAEDYPVEFSEAPMTLNDAGESVLTEYGLDQVLYHDCPLALRTARRRTRPESMAVFGQVHDETPAWRVKPSTYVRCELDRIVRPDLQKMFAERGSMTQWDLHSGHMPMFARPGELTTVLAELARG